MRFGSATRAGLGAAVATAVTALALIAPAAPASSSSLYQGPSPRPGPDLLYAGPANAPQLENTGIWSATPILVSGGESYRNGEFVYQDFLYDDHGAHEVFDPTDPKTPGNLFSKPSGTYTYPTATGYANNAADLVEWRVRPFGDATAFRVTLNTLKDPSLIAFTIAIGTSKKAHGFPFGANVSAPARLFLTVHPAAGGALVANLVDAGSGAAVPGPVPSVALDRRRRQIEVRVDHRAWNPTGKTVRFATGVGLWDSANGRYLLPQAAASATAPGGSGVAVAPAAFFNVAFRTAEPFPSVTDSTGAVLNPGWWREKGQATDLAAGDLSGLHADVDFRRLADHVRDDSAVPKTGAIDRILPSHFETHQGADFSVACLTASTDCTGPYLGRLQPYAIYVPAAEPPAGGFGMTLLLHSLSANYNQYLGTRNQKQFGNRGPGSITITPESRGPDGGNESYAAADVFDVWADVARHYRLDPAWTTITGYSLGGIGTFKLGSEFPDLFARAQPTVGDESSNEVLASLRNVPVLMWNNIGDELVNMAGYDQTALALDQLGYRYELDQYQPCTNPGCSPLFPNHLQLAINDQYAPAAHFLGTHRVNRDPFHVTYVVFPERSHPELGFTGNHAYWVGGLKLRDTSASSGQIDAVSHGFGKSDPTPSSTALGTGSLTGGNFGTLTFSSTKKTWGKTPSAPVSDQLDVTATNIAKATINVERARVSCQVQVNVATDGPIDINLPGCGRTVHAEGGR